MLKPFFNYSFSLKLKIVSLFMLLVVAMMATVTYIFTIREQNMQLKQVEQRMERLAKNIATIRSVETKDWDVYQSYIDNQLLLNSDIVYIAIFDEFDQLKAYSLNTSWVELDESSVSEKWEHAQIIHRLEQRQIAEESLPDFESKSVNIIIGKKNLGTVKVGFSLIELNDSLKHNLQRNLQLALIFIVIAIFISFFMSYTIITPLTKLTNAMYRISHGDLNQEINITSRDEIGEMATTFNFMTRGLREKETIEKFGRELSFTIELDKICRLITEQITQALNANQGAIFLRTKNYDTRFYLVHIYPEHQQENYTFDCHPGLCNYFLKHRKPSVLNHLEDYPEFIRQLEKAVTICEDTIISPIIIKEEVSGLFLLGGQVNNLLYSEREKDFISTLISQASFALENALLYQELTSQEKLKRELEIARTVQQGLLPQQKPEIAGLDIDGICLPATEVGGDYYDYFPINKHTIGIAIADVAGKGTYAAFYMAVVKGIMLSLTPIILSPKRLLAVLNKKLYGNMERSIFITMIYAVFDLQKKVLKFSRAGHNSLIMRDGETSRVECLTPRGIGLGLVKRSVFDRLTVEQSVHFKKGDQFLFYTDGISEAMNNDRDEFTEEKLVEIFANSDHLHAKQIQERIIAAVNDFTQKAPQHDDITMVNVIAE